MSTTPKEEDTMPKGLTDAQMEVWRRTAVKLREEPGHKTIAKLRKENAELRDRNSTYLLRLKTEEQCRQGWQARAMEAEAKLKELEAA